MFQLFVQRAKQLRSPVYSKCYTVNVSSDLFTAYLLTVWLTSSFLLCTGHLWLDQVSTKCLSHQFLLTLLSGSVRLCVCLSSVHLSLSSLYLLLVLFFLSVRVSLSNIRPTVPPSGAVDKGGQGGAGPSPGASDSGGGACSGSGAGPSRSDSVRSMVTGGSKAGRWQTVQSHMHAGGLRFSK